MRYVYDDGGRASAGFKGTAGDCVCRAITIASGRPYSEVYKRVAEGNAAQRITKRQRRKTNNGKTARNGICTQRKWFKNYMRKLGFEWVRTMKGGEGCKVHLKDGEIPMGRLW